MNEKSLCFMLDDDELNVAEIELFKAVYFFYKFFLVYYITYIFILGFLKNFKCV